MKIYLLTAIAALALPFMAISQTTDEQQTTTQGPTKETQTTAPAKGKKMRPAQESTSQAKPETGTNVRGQTNIQGRTRDAKIGTGTRSSASQTSVTGTNQTTTTVNKDEFRVFVDGCWVAVDVDGFVYTERMICAGDPEFIAVD
jgi:hypothetical protein